MPNLFVPRETAEGETRVAATPETVKHFRKEGLDVSVEAGAGMHAHVSDSAWEEAGATVTGDAAQGWSTADLVVKVAPPSIEQVRQMREGAILIAFLAPHQNLDLVRAMAERKITSLAMELIPRVTRAQSMDALSSQASIAGYKAVLLAAWRLQKYFPLLMTAAGTIKPARVVIMGAGVAGLQAVATARKLGAIVEVSDIRPAVKEQVESLGGRFIELPMEETGEGTGGYAKEMTPEFLRKQREIVARHVAAADVVITTAQIPGKKAPMLVTREMVEGMRAGAIIIDMAVDSGGNCELSEPGIDVLHQGVTIIGASSLPATTAEDASLLYSRNVHALVGNLLDEGQPKIDLEDEITAGSLLTHAGEVRHAPTAELLKGGR